MESPVDNHLVADVARRILRRAAPEELTFFTPSCAAYFADPDRALTPVRQQREPLGAGSDVVVTLLTPVVLAVTAEVLKYLYAELTRTVASRTTTGVLRRMFGAGGGAGTAPPLDQRQLAEVRRIVREKALAVDLPEEKASLLVDSVAGALTGSE